MADDTSQVSSEILRAIRGSRSQIAFARRLGYRANPITDWENRRSFPTVNETFRAMSLVKRSPRAAMNKLLPSGPCPSDPGAWLNALRGSLSISDLARAVNRSRYVVSRWLSGRTEARLPEFLHVVSVLTDRLPEFAGALVGIENLPSLRPSFERVENARRLSLEQPWTAAVQRLLETKKINSCAGDPVHDISQALGIEEQHVAFLIEELVQAGVVARRGKKLTVVKTLTIDTSATPAQRNALRTHWARVGLDRLRAHPPDDWFAYNVLSVSKRDSKRVEEILRAAYREVRSVVADSKPEDEAMLLSMHLVRW